MEVEVKFREPKNKKNKWMLVIIFIFLFLLLFIKFNILSLASIILYSIYLFLLHINTKGQQDKITIAFAFLAFGISILTFMGSSYDLRLKNRPYLYIDVMQPDTWLYTDSKAGVSGNRKIRTGIRVYNKGVIPASNVKFNWYIATDMDGRRVSPEEFYKMEYGKAPQYKTIFPGESIKLPDYQPDVSPATRKLFVNVVVSYEGTARSIFGSLGKYIKYWYLFKSEYEFDYAGPNHVYMSQTYFESDWDRDQNGKLPKLGQDKNDTIAEKVEK